MFVLHCKLSREDYDKIHAIEKKLYPDIVVLSLVLFAARHAYWEWSHLQLPHSATVNRNYIGRGFIMYRGLSGP